MCTAVRNAVAPYSNMPTIPLRSTASTSSIVPIASASSRLSSATSSTASTTPSTSTASVPTTSSASPTVTSTSTSTSASTTSSPSSSSAAATQTSASASDYRHSSNFVGGLVGAALLLTFVLALAAYFLRRHLRSRRKDSALHDVANVKPSSSGKPHYVQAQTTEEKPYEDPFKATESHRASREGSAAAFHPHVRAGTMPNGRTDADDLVVSALYAASSVGSKRPLGPRPRSYASLPPSSLSGEPMPSHSSDLSHRGTPIYPQEDRYDTDVRFAAAFPLPGVSPLVSNDDQVMSPSTVRPPSTVYPDDSISVVGGATPRIRGLGTPSRADDDATYDRGGSLEEERANRSSAGFNQLFAQIPGSLSISQPLEKLLD